MTIHGFLHSIFSLLIISLVLTWMLSVGYEDPEEIEHKKVMQKLIDDRNTLLRRMGRRKPHKRGSKQSIRRRKPASVTTFNVHSTKDKHKDNNAPFQASNIQSISEAELKSAIASSLTKHKQSRTPAKPRSHPLSQSLSQTVLQSLPQPALHDHSHAQPDMLSLDRVSNAPSDVYTPPKKADATKKHTIAQLSSGALDISKLTALNPAHNNRRAHFGSSERHFYQHGDHNNDNTRHHGACERNADDGYNFRNDDYYSDNSSNEGSENGGGHSIAIASSPPETPLDPPANPWK